MKRIKTQDQICAREIAKLFETIDENTKAYIVGYSQGISEKMSIIHRNDEKSIAPK